jgi:hypothetical protein
LEETEIDVSITADFVRVIAQDQMKRVVLRIDCRLARVRVCAGWERPPKE